MQVRWGDGASQCPRLFGGGPHDPFIPPRPRHSGGQPGRCLCVVECRELMNRCGVGACMEGSSRDAMRVQRHP